VSNHQEGVFEMTWSMPKLTTAKVLTGALFAAVACVAAGLSTASAAQAATPRCTTAGLEVWLGLGGGGAQAGSTVYPMEFTNVSNRTCQLFGFPGVSAEAGGHQAGRPAARDHTVAAQTVTLHPGATAHVRLQITDVGVFAPSTCKPVTADGLRVFAPGATRAATIPFRFRACSANGPVFLHVTAMQPRVGVPGHP
jgi:hypothetical protein